MGYTCIKKPHFVYLSGKPMTAHLLRYQRFAVDDHGFTLDALNLGYPQLSIHQGNNKLAKITG